jgi:hypothetical protein
MTGQTLVMMPEINTPGQTSALHFQLPINPLWSRWCQCINRLWVPPQCCLPTTTVIGYQHMVLEDLRQERARQGSVPHSFSRIRD